jgi:hypothetical protein
MINYLTSISPHYNHDIYCIILSHSDIQNRYRKLQAQSDVQIQEYRTTVKLKEFDIERVSMAYEENMTEFRKLKIEMEAQTQKNKILKSEYYTLQMETAKSILNLENSNKSLNE